MAQELAEHLRALASEPCAQADHSQAPEVAEPLRHLEHAADEVATA